VLVLLNSIIRNHERYTRYLSFPPIKKNQNLETRANLVNQSLSFPIVPLSHSEHYYLTNSREYHHHRITLLAKIERPNGYY